MKFFPLILFLTIGCQTTTQTSKVNSTPNPTSRFIDTEIGAETSLIINSSDLVRKTLVWTTQNPENDKILVTIENAELNTISENKSCSENLHESGFTCSYFYIFQSKQIDNDAKIIFETQRLGHLLAKYEIALKEGNLVTQTTSKFYKIGDQPDASTVVRKGDALMFEADWSTRRYGRTKSETVHFGVDLTKIWEHVNCDQGECRYKALFQVDGASQQGAIAVHLVDQGNSVKTWQQQIIVR